MKYADIPILMYHDIFDADSPWCVSPSDFTRQMQWLREQGYNTITLTQLQQGLAAGLETNKKLVAITFDDGRQGVWDQAYPLFRSLGFSATVFIVPSWIEKGSAPLEENYSAFLTWDQLRALSEQGFEIGSHSFSHANLSVLTREEIVQELQQAERVVAHKLNQKMHHFCYPYGKYNPLVRDVVSQRYTAAVSIRKGFDKSAFEYARQWVLRNMDLQHFQRLLRKPTLSACLIVKNEERFLRDCLHSVQGLADEIIIVDTGSMDATKDIAREFTGKVFDFSWCDDFAAARNESIRQATGDWILIIDADEVIAEEDRATILEAMNECAILGYRILTRNYSNDSSFGGWHPIIGSDPSAKSFRGWHPSLKVRLFQRREDVQFKGRVHEMVDASLEPLTISSLPVVVHHYGELRWDSAEAKGQKLRFHIDLAKKKIADSPTDAQAYYELGIQYKLAQELSPAEEMLQESLRLDGSALTPLVELALVQQRLGKVEVALDNFQAVLRQNPTHAEALFGLGFCYFRTNELDLAADAFQKAVQANPCFVEAFVNLGAIREKQGRFTEAVSFLKKGLQLNPGHGRAYYNLGVVYEKQQALENAIDCYERAIVANYARKAELEQKVARIKEFLLGK